MSARLTLGRALLQLGDLESAQRELETVLTQAPENLAAMRGVAEIHRRRGNLVQSLERYRAALELAKDDSELEQVLTELTREVAAQVDTSRSESLPPPESETLPVPPVETAERALEPTIDDRKLMLALRTMGALEEWLAACHVARAQRRAE